MKMHKRVIALLLAVCMVLPTCVTALAEEKTLNYVALGDSMSQGYMFLDYNEDPLQGHFCGWKGSSEYSYIKKFANYLQAGFNGKVNFNDLTIQGLQPDEVYAFLKPETFDFDSMTRGARKHIGWWTKEYDTDEEQSPDIYLFDTFADMSDYYIDAIKNADVITFDIGENYFGTWLSDLHDENEEYTDLMKSSAYYDEIISLRSILNTSAYLLGMDNSTIEHFLYACLSYMAYSDSCIAAIKELNPDVQIILLPLINPHKEMYVTIGGIKICYSDLLDDLMDYLNNYMAKKSPCRNMYTIAEYDGDVTSFADELYFYPDDLSADAEALIDSSLLGMGGLLGVEYPKLPAGFAEFREYAAATYGVAALDYFFDMFLLIAPDEQGNRIVDEDGNYLTMLSVFDKLVYEYIEERYGSERAYNDFYGANYLESVEAFFLEMWNPPATFFGDCDSLLDESILTYGMPWLEINSDVLANARQAEAAGTAKQYQLDILEAADSFIGGWKDTCLKAATYRTTSLDLLLNIQEGFGYEDLIRVITDPENATDEDYTALHMALRMGNAARGFGAHPCPRGLDVKYRAVVEAFDENIREKIDGMMNAITVHYVYSDGTEAYEDYTDKVEIGSKYNIKSPEITGYTPDTDAVAGVMGKNNVEATVTYKNVEEGECVVSQKVDLTEGKLNLFLNGKDMGEFTFAKDGEYWTIKDSNGQYLWSSGSSLSRRNTACDWRYNNGCFSISVRNSGFWLFGRITTYYLTCSNNKLTMSTSKTNATAEFYQMSEGGSHEAAASVIENEQAETCSSYGSYDEVIYCEKCGEELVRTHHITEPTGAHVHGTPVTENEKAATCTVGGSYDEAVYCDTCGIELVRTHNTTEPTGHTPGEAKIETIDGVKKLVTRCTKCGDIRSIEDAPEGEITAKVNVETSTSRFLFFFTTTTYKVSIAAESSIPRVTISNVQYSTNGVRWTNGSNYSTSTRPGTIYVRVSDSSGATTYFMYNYSTGKISEY